MCKHDVLLLGSLVFWSGRQNTGKIKVADRKSLLNLHEHIV